ncbi:MAG: aspartate aminotransferase family protein [Gammaproteobacteria bacterium]|jgi:acetylornithine/N-succinyldiaminopimelate aminotransferase|nr:aspartate aminotransferase family protein [Gammaproteobacteria bacterium]
MSKSIMTTYNRLPVAFVSGEGSWLIDDKGERYLDALSGISVCNIGHSNPKITATICEQAGRLMHTSNLYEVPLQAQLADRLIELSGLDQVFFCNSGAEANEAAIKLCRKSASQRGMTKPVIVVMQGSFHGRTMATLSATGNSKVHEGFSPLVQGFHHLPYDDLDALNGLVDQNMEVIAVMLEPIQGEGGVVIPSEGYLRAVREICTKNNWLMVVDEIQTGMCRTGLWFACQHENVSPDIMTLAKSLGNGVPIGACIANTGAAEAMNPGSHGSTFGGNPLAASTALAVIEYMTENHLPERVSYLGEMMLSRFRKELGGLAEVVNIRGKGLMIGIQLDRDCAQLVKLALERKLLINVTAANVIRLLPPLTMSEEEMDIIVKNVSELIINFVNG